MALLTLAALLLRLHHLGYESLDVDEADLLAFAQQDWGTLLARLTQPGENGPLFVILLRLWIGLAGHSEAALRLFSVLPATFSIPMAYLLGKRLFDHRTGLLTALLLACSSYQLFYAQMVKMYALVLLLALLSCWLLIEGIERPRWRTWAAYTIVTTALMYTHIFGAMILPWHFIVALLNLRRSVVAPWSVSLALLTLPYLPLAFLRLAALRAPETLTRQFTGSRELPGMFATLAREYGTRFDLLPLPLLDAVFVGLTLLGLAALLLPRLDPPVGVGASQRLRRVFMAAGLAAPLAATFALVSLGAPVFSSRYLIMVLPVFYLLWALGIGRVADWRRTPAAALLLLIFGLNAARWSESAFQGKRFREDWRGAVERVRPLLGAGDQVVVLHDPSWRAVHYYAGEGWPLVSLEGGPERPADLTRLPARSAGERVWVLAAWFEAPDLPPLEARLAERSRLESKEWDHGVLVSSYRTP